MPLFEYECRDCGRSFEAFVTTDRTADCPACQGTNLRKLLSSPGMVGSSNGGERAAERSFPAGGGCGAGGAGCACRAGAMDS